MRQLKNCDRTFGNATLCLMCYIYLLCQSALPIDGFLSRPGDVMLGGLFSMHYDVQVAQDNRATADSLCENFRYRGFRELNAMRFAIEEINNSTTLLPNVTLGYNIFDDCNNVKKALAASLRFAARNNIATIGFDDDCSCDFKNPATLGVVGPTSSDITISVANLLGLFDIPMISYAATSKKLSNKNQFPQFLRTVPSDFEQPKVMAEVVAYFNWTWVGTIAGDNAYGRPGIEQFLVEAENKSICVAFTRYITATEGIDEALQAIENNLDVKVIVAFIGGSNLAPLMRRVTRQDITWIASEAWSTSSSILQFTDVTRGTLGVQLRTGQISGFWEYLSNLSPLKEPNNKLLQAMWEEEFDCKYEPDNTTCANELSPTDTSATPTPTFNVATQNCTTKLCTKQENLQGSELLNFNELELTTAYHTYVAVYAYAHALHNIFTCSPVTSPLPDRSCPNVSAITPRQLLQFVRKVNFTDAMGETVAFDMNGEPPPLYSILNWQERDGRLEIIRVANYAGKQGLQMNQSIQWNNGGNVTEVPVSTCSETCAPGHYKGRITGKPACCWQCLLCGEGNISTTIDADSCTPCGETEYSNRDHTACLPREVDFLDWKDPMAIIFLSLAGLGVLLTVLITILFFMKRNTPVVKASSRELLFLLLLGLLVCFLSFLPYIGRPTDVSCIIRPYPLGLGFVLSISVILVKTNRVRVIFEARLPTRWHRKWLGIRIQLLSVFLAVLLMLIVLIVWSLVATPKPDENYTIQRDKIFLECKAGTWVGWGIMIGYIVLLAMCCFYFAFKARKLPENFNEAKFIVLSMLIFFIVWISIIPAYLGTTGKFVVMSQGIAIYASTFGLLACFYFPKCWVILVTPERNTLEYIRQSTTEHSFVTAARVTMKRRTDETETSGGSSKGSLKSFGSLLKKSKKDVNGSRRKSESISMDQLSNKNMSNNNRLSPLDIRNSPEAFRRERSCSSPTIIITEHDGNTRDFLSQAKAHIVNEQKDNTSKVPKEDELSVTDNPKNKSEATSHLSDNPSTCFNFDVVEESQSIPSSLEMQEGEDKSVLNSCKGLRSDTESSMDSLDSNTGCPLLSGYKEEADRYNTSVQSSLSVPDMSVQPFSNVSDTPVQPHSNVSDTPVKSSFSVPDITVQPPSNVSDTSDSVQPPLDTSVQPPTVQPPPSVSDTSVQPPFDPSVQPPTSILDTSVQPLQPPSSVYDTSVQPPFYTSVQPPTSILDTSVQPLQPPSSVSDTSVQPPFDTSAQPPTSILDTSVQPPSSVSDTSVPPPFDTSVQPPTNILDTSVQPLYDTSVQPPPSFTDTFVQPPSSVQPSFNTSAQPPDSILDTSVQPLYNTSVQPSSSVSDKSVQPPPSFTDTFVQPPSSVQPSYNTSAQPPTSILDTSVQPLYDTSVQPASSVSDKSVQPPPSFTDTFVQPLSSVLPSFDTSIQPPISILNTSVQPLHDTIVQPPSSVRDKSVQPPPSFTDTFVQPPSSVQPSFDTSVQPPDSILGTSVQPLYDMSVQSATPNIDRTTPDELDHVTFV